jgi:hypothetical protein
MDQKKLKKSEWVRLLTKIGNQWFLVYSSLPIAAYRIPNQSRLLPDQVDITPV